ncbi:YeiH family protein [Haloparvum sp. PAK95]|uniref:YeiH family protein n=1 Tax=Haloparvum sp. PAK95 TaxID=3418962 RepID=UPI003D2EFBFF
MIPAIRRLVPGLALLGAVAGGAAVVGTALPVVTPLLLAIGLGAVVANTVGVPRRFRPGVATHSRLLEVAIVLLGARLSLDAIVAAGPRLAALVLGIVGFGLVVVTALARIADLNDRLGTLLAAGSSICGISAVAAVAPICEAEDSEVAHAAATILLFDAVTLLVFPAVGRVLGLDSTVYGVWIGLSMFSTGPVAAAGFAHSAVAGEWATVTKLARNALIGLVAVGYSVRYVGGVGNAHQRVPRARRIWTEFPTFLLGFLLLAVITTLGVVPAAVVDALVATSDVLFLLAFAGLGFDISLAAMRKTGVVPIAVVGTYLVVASGLAYVLVALAF